MSGELMKSELIFPESVAGNSGKNQLPEPLRKFYDAFLDVEPGTYDKGSTTVAMGLGLENARFGPANITVGETLVSVVHTGDYALSKGKDMTMLTLQGYAQLILFDRFYASCVMIGKESSNSVSSVTKLVTLLKKTDEERETITAEELEKAKISPSFYASIHNNPIMEAESTRGIYVILDRNTMDVSCDTVLSAMGIANLVDNDVFGIAVGVGAEINTFKNSMAFTVAATIKFAQQRFTVAGELGLLNGKINSLAFSVQGRIQVTAGVAFTELSISVKGFQEPKLAFGLGAGVALGEKMSVPEGLGIVKKAIFSDKKEFYPIELTVNGEINPLRNYYSVSGKGTFMGWFSISGSVKYDNGDWDAGFKAGLVRNRYINASLELDYRKRKDVWSIHGNLNGSVMVDWKNLLGITVKGELDLRLTSQDYTISGYRHNLKILSVSVSGMAKVKVLFTFNISVQKSWLFTLSHTISPVRSADAMPEAMFDPAKAQETWICESVDVAENKTLPISVKGDAIDAKSWKIDRQCSKSGIVKFQVAAQYTLADTSWRLTYSNGNSVTVYTAANAGDTVSLKEFTHSYYELLVDTPDAGNWTLEILGDRNSSGGLYLDALQDEKIISSLEIAEQSDTAIKFKYSAFTDSGDDKTMVQLFAEEISDTADNSPYQGVIAYLKEAKNGEYLWEIPDEFRHNATYRFYIVTASSDAALTAESNSVEVELDRKKAKLDCSWELVYSGNDTNTVTAYITVTNTGSESTAFQWKLLDYTNGDSFDADNIGAGDTADTADVIAAGEYAEIKGNSTITFTSSITITDELRDNPSSLQLSVNQCVANLQSNAGAARADDRDAEADDVDDITFSAMNSMYSRQKTISWRAVDGAAAYVLQYALEGDWDESGVFVNGITDTSYTISAAPGEYSYRVIALDNAGNALGSWSREKEVDVLFSDRQIISISGKKRTSRSQEFALNDGIYDLNGITPGNLNGTLVLYRKDLVKVKSKHNSVRAKVKEKKILSLKFVNGKLTKPAADVLLDHGDYFWKWTARSKKTSPDSEISMQLSGEVFSEEQQDRESIVIGGEDSDIPMDHAGANTETLSGEVGFCNADAIYNYITGDGGELTLSIRRGTVLDAKLKIHIYVQSEKSDKFLRRKTLTVKAGKYSENKVILNDMSIKNNFYVRIASWDKGKGKHNTDYSFDLSFDAFKDNDQIRDIIEVDGAPVSEWIGYRNDAHRYLLQIDSDDAYAVRLQGDAGDAVLKICNLKGRTIKSMRIKADGKACIDNIKLKQGNYFVVVTSRDKGKGKYNTDYTLSVSKFRTLYPKIDNSDDTRKQASLLEAIELDSRIENWLGAGDKTDFFKIDLEENIRPSTLSIYFDAQTTQAIEDGILKFTYYNKFGRTLALKECAPGEWQIKKQLSGAQEEVYIGVSLKKKADSVDYSFETSLLH